MVICSNQESGQDLIVSFILMKPDTSPAVKVFETMLLKYDNLQFDQKFSENELFALIA